jgi:hypothetical protein
MDETKRARSDWPVLMGIAFSLIAAYLVAYLMMVRVLIAVGIG